MKTNKANAGKNTGIRDSVSETRMVPALDVKELFHGFREVRLRHGAEEYRLRLTKNDKLILTK